LPFKRNLQRYNAAPPQQLMTPQHSLVLPSSVLSMDDLDAAASGAVVGAVQVVNLVYPQL
jgi:hypothetical protein